MKLKKFKPTSYKTHNAAPRETEKDRNFVKQHNANVPTTGTRKPFTGKVTPWSTLRKGK